ncbi:MAG: hypothetical protein M3186_17965 [Actinomycetota bacterium]|nr:hypothetical protein [Actinomycetota bacterium]
MSGIEAKGSITADRPVDEVFAYWQGLENLPQFMTHYSRLPDPAPRRR